MSTRRVALSLTGVAAIGLAAGCGRSDDARPNDTAAAGASAAADTAWLHPQAPGDVVITTTNGEVSLALIGDSVLMGLSERTLRKVGESTDTTALKARDGFGAWMEKTVKGAVQRGLSYRIAYPLSDVQNVRYEDGGIRFDLRDEKTFSFDNVKVDDKRPALDAFSQEDAQRFVSAVRARKEGGRDSAQQMR